MKINATIFLLVFISVSALLNGQTTAILDPIFENYLETHTSDGIEVNVGDPESMGDGIANNGLVLTDRINNVVLLDISGLGITDLTGIEDFTALETLFCSNNNLSNLNVSSNINLASLLCGANRLTQLMLNNNISLETLNCSNNQLQSLIVTNNTALKSLTASGNQLTSIDVSNNSNLSLLAVSNNRITGELSVEENLNLESLFCASNQISTLNLTSNTVLKTLNASGNLLTTLDLSTVNTLTCPEPQTNPLTVCQGSASVDVSRNRLTSLVVSNGFNELFVVFNASENPELFCIQLDPEFTPISWIKDDWTYYSETTCEDIYTYIPDNNFEQALIDLGYDDTLDNLILTANINSIENLNISNKSISNLTGIEDFIALEILDCSSNNIENLNLSNNTFLQELEVSNNNLTALDIRVNFSLVTLYCSNNLIPSLDVSTLMALTTLHCSNNNFASFNLGNNLLLNDLDVSFNQIEYLNLVANSALTSVFCNDNNLFALNLKNGNNNVMTALNATNNANLFCIEVDDVGTANAAPGWQKDATAAFNLDCGTYIPDDNFEQALIDLGIDSDNTLNNYVATADINTLVALDISGLAIENLTGIEDFISLESLYCSNNTLAALNLSTLSALQMLDCSNNQILDLNLTLNPALISVFANNNALLNLNVKNGNNNLLTTFNTTTNPNLYCINVDNNIVENIPAGWQKDTIASYNDDCVNNRFTAIPDAFFEQALINLGYDDVVDGQVLTSNIEQVLSLNISNKSIEDLTGIQDFKSLIELDCSGNFLNDLNVSNMFRLERLNCSSNYLLTNDVNDPNGLLNITGTVSLRELLCASNNLSYLDTSLNLNLEILDCADNNLQLLDVNSNSFLRNLNASNNNLTSLDLISNQALENVNINSNQLNDLITTEEMNSSLTVFSCANNNISNLSIAHYQALTSLNCGSNVLTELNVEGNSALNFLSITNNQIAELNLFNNTDLLELEVSQNILSQLILTENTVLERLNCDFNDLPELNLNSNIELQILSCANNQLIELDLSDNSNIVEANFNSNNITSLILSNNLAALKRINASNNQIEDALDLSTMAQGACVFQPSQTEFCPETIAVNVSNNLLDFINIQNGINSEIASFNASGNPNLTCIQVDDVNNVPANWIKDQTTTYNEDCNFGETYVPDNNFEQALIDLGLDTGPLNNYVLTANIETLLSLDVSSNNIADLTGIEDFTALENLDFSNNNLSEIDLSSNVNLLNLDCSDNLLANLNIESNTALTTVNCSSNAISNLNLIANTNLSILNISDNIFTAFIPSEVLSLLVFNADNNNLLELDFQQNQLLTNLSCESNLLETLNIRNGQNLILTELNAQNNPNLTCIETDNGTVPNNATWLVDAATQLAINCFFGLTYVPDNNFEQTLINLGYDTGDLDNYVPTVNIEAITFLNIAEREISDLTGIEAFISLSTLNFEGNTIETVDLSNNPLLVNLNASDNILSNLDLSMLSSLAVLNVSQNNLTQLNFDFNLGLRDLNVSNNELTNLNLNVLSGLEKLNCESNLLTGLDVSQNPVLTSLFCQSNSLVGDQLNMQNGNNENLQLFNAINNPDLFCILVDDPIAVISNTDGLYNNWFKDASASYQLICDDADNDGVPNEDDLCPNTPFGATVDLFGCAIPDLPNNNFAISITGETCLNSNNGKINIIAQELYSYTATLIRENFNEVYNFTNDVDIFNLLAGTYEMCITIEEWPDYQSCYTIIITEPNPLEVFSSRMPSSNQLSLSMSGGNAYNVKLNGDTFTTHNSTIILQLQSGINTLKITTDRECQGYFEESIIYSDGALVYPNPFKSQLNIFANNQNEEVTVNIYTTLGQLILTKTYINQGVETRLDTGALTDGIFIITVQSETTTSTYKIIKE
ncbi:T9SS type A sorting domain-containing protein [Paucihalobacter sp.]|uniref:T9SS type A sorting domain-containing protein n=1 Tax=Paucihalobacter sp. TaxID=2850405 RepID=UPI003D161EAC